MTSTAPAATVDRRAAWPVTGLLVTGQGATTIATTVVRRTAGTAAREVSGVHGLGSGATRALAALRDRVPGASASAGQGVSVGVGEKRAAIDTRVVLDHGVPIPAVARAGRANPIAAVEDLTGLEAVEAGIAVEHVHMPGDNGERAALSRVR
ncbi:Asp23/Gls24 family envelope stress response protein [Prauserella endophytica]|uniref:Asp23/Gls24 family envelope stress response protein n=1 Tax=Prauserella endophytica TaxID=1592324 RepID=A0ABY2SAQ0_9PSEU|nr:Asp23/Gls24 family envelope stress response protein [Prauserella endophytica]TKG72912.1 Asp23/Gls24 family envelope stress response protein [Prauserella endophytica]